MATIIDGKRVSAEIEQETVAGVARLAEQGITPGLAVVLVGEDPASQSYVGMKERDCERIGIRSFDHRLPAETSQEDLNRLIDGLNANPDVHGILVQLPLPGHLDTEAIIARISPDKDVDGFHPENLGRLVRGLPGHRACTPFGVMKMLESYGIDPAGKHAVVVGRSTIVGKPMALLLLNANATVTVCHSRTKDLAATCRQADILVAAVGRAKMLTSEYVKPGAVVIDVGINRADTGLVGDVDYDDVLPIASAITPVPGGVGPMTRAILMLNTVEAAGAAV
ncbi:MAG: bifunctional methylenetetrahydrofolate dehydrogenase/methenyltetrahydrofolate cyclohydrolase FolD [Coriobacteriia bacterium]|nr:bifunctional methylenetetrahydrofolate dehydrogenase/methenyltetrahydrofolate cyclohydrolase FolD [Coriobacteriia bacterium]MBN2823217.1 bifunctional methylenetetrahydrofolate dehydrogenase/methenyltetrahydrofolate cyclohydrolase FolD [Coriobacteriia bacterium]